MKSAGLRIRIEPQLRQAFLDACQNNDKSAAQVLRSFMRQYVNEYPASRQGDLFAREGEPSYTTRRTASTR